MAGRLLLHQRLSRVVAGLRWEVDDGLSGVVIRLGIDLGVVILLGGVGSGSVGEEGLGLDH